MRWLACSAACAIFAIACGGGSSPTMTPGAAAACDSPTPTASFNGLIGGGAIVRFKDAVLDVEVADTAAEREVGLMNRACLGADAGMLFVFPSDTNTTFWMKDTLIPLSIAFVKADGTIVHIEDMQPQTEMNHYSTEPYRYAIEANQGWFAAHGVVEGGPADILIMQ